MRSFVMLIGFVALLVGILLGFEALRLGPFATAERIGEYRFGSEAMVGNGGVAYRSRAHYVTLTAIPSILLLMCAGLSWFFARSGRTLHLVAASASLVAALLIVYVL